MPRDDTLITQLHETDDPALLLAELPASTLRRLARSYGLLKTIGQGRYYARPENAARLALAERLRRAGLPHRQHAGWPVQLTPDAATAFRAELLRQAKLVRVVMPEALRAELAALELLLVVAAQAGGSALGEDQAQLLAEVRALLANPREAAIIAQARTLAGVLVALLG